MRTPIMAAGLAFALTNPGFSQNHTVVPQQHTTTDAPHQFGVPGVVEERTQVLIGAAHLTNLIGQEIQSIQLRRNAATEAFGGGQVNVTLHLSISPNDPLSVSRTFNDNVGANPTAAFSGLVDVPTSPSAAGPTVNWTGNNVVTIPVGQQFIYLGGTLCIDISGEPAATQGVSWWAADAAFEHLPGNVQDLGGGCGGIGGTPGDWSSVERHSLVVGGHAHMIAYGSPNGIAMCAIGHQSTPIPLSIFGFTPPGACDLRVFPIISLELIPLQNPSPGFNANGWRGDWRIKIPNLPGAQGLTMTTQWFDWSQQALSDAHEWTVAASIPTLDMASVEGHKDSNTGKASVHIAPVIRLGHDWPTP